MSPIWEILSPILETLSADVEMLSPIGEILSLIWEILALIWAILSPNFGETLSPERGEFQLMLPFFFSLVIGKVQSVNTTSLFVTNSYSSLGNIR